MKKLTTLTALLVGLIITISSCTKEGPAGKDGQDGASGTVDCIKCHDNSQVIYTKSMQWAASTHATGGNFNRNSESCAPCHTSQGFLEVLETGNTVTAAVVNDPAPINCYACHNIHKSYTEDDWDLTATDAINFQHLTVNSDQGTANLCINCHQSRAVSPWPDAAAPNDSSTITSYRFGPHHGPQGNLFAGTGGYEIGGGYTNSVHSTQLDNSCLSCHMGTASGVSSGGHTMGFNTSKCSSCHTDAAALDTKIANTQSEITVLFDSLETILLNKGHLRPDKYVTTGTYTNDDAGIIYNYVLVKEDRSLGVHNYPYIKKLLQNSIAAAK
ncbi:MAG: hypothetical protein JXR34_09215 [Bacteroidales bacterium]|nr:hypothetical protein [Bacteroidales bacterium]